MGRTFSGRDDRGLAGSRKAFVVLTGGQDYAPDAPITVKRHVTPYLRTVFGAIGSTKVTVIPVATGRAEPLARTEQRALGAMELAMAA